MMRTSSNLWHNKMYDYELAKFSLNSADLKKKAKREVDFIVSELSLQKDDYVLDIPCGTGRHSYYLARKGLRVLGLDISTGCLEIAREKLSHQNIVYKKGNMANMGRYRNTFNALINLFTSFGYFANDQENRDILSNFFHALKKGGQVVLQVINRDCLLQQYPEKNWRENREKYVLDQLSYCPKTHYLRSRNIMIDKKMGTIKTYYYRLRTYDKREMVSLLKDVGFKQIKVYGDFYGNPFNKFQSNHPFYVARK